MTCDDRQCGYCNGAENRRQSEFAGIIPLSISQLTRSRGAVGWENGKCLSVVFVMVMSVISRNSPALIMGLPVNIQGACRKKFVVLCK